MFEPTLHCTTISQHRRSRTRWPELCSNEAAKMRTFGVGRSSWRVGGLRCGRGVTVDSILVFWKLTLAKKKLPESKLRAEVAPCSPSSQWAPDDPSDPGIPRTAGTARQDCSHCSRLSGLPWEVCSSFRACERVHGQECLPRTLSCLLQVIPSCWLPRPPPARPIMKGVSEVFFQSDARGLGTSKARVGEDSFCCCGC